MYDMGICFNLSIEISQLIGSAPQVRALALLYLPIQISVLRLSTREYFSQIERAWMPD
jgi:hypothetical protein